MFVYLLDLKHIHPVIVFGLKTSKSVSKKKRNGLIFFFLLPKNVKRYFLPARGFIPVQQTRIVIDSEKLQRKQNERITKGTFSTVQ